MMTVYSFLYQERPSDISVNTILFQTGLTYNLHRMVMFLDRGFIKYTIQYYNELNQSWSMHPDTIMFDDKFNCFLHLIKIIQDEFLNDNSIIIYNLHNRVRLIDDFVYLEKSSTIDNPLDDSWVEVSVFHSSLIHQSLHMFYDLCISS